MEEERLKKNEGEEQLKEKEIYIPMIFELLFFFFLFLFFLFFSFFFLFFFSLFFLFFFSLFFLFFFFLFSFFFLFFLLFFFSFFFLNYYLVQANRQGDLLRRLGFQIPGMNAVQLYLKVAGSRTPGHQENNVFVSGNLSLGPGDCEWFCIDHKYWPQIERMCKERGIDYFNGTWWPHPIDLAAANIPLIRFIQHPGDFVYVNYGCIHWVQAQSRCSNVAWNMGPATVTQFRMAWERQLYLESIGNRSLVPMEFLSWQLIAIKKLKELPLMRAVRC